MVDDCIANVRSNSWPKTEESSAKYRPIIVKLQLFLQQSNFNTTINATMYYFEKSINHR